ncbi:MAG: invasion associated locus B family protein [Granulosicoccus sp.]
MISYRQRRPSLIQRAGLTPTGTAAGVVIGLLLCSSAFAQSDGGLKLGQPTEQAPVEKLDLGAPAPADRSTQTAPATAARTAPQAQANPGVTRETVGAWDVACPPEGSNCAMAQIGNDASGTPVLEMVIRKLEEPLEVGERTAIAVLDVITPLGVVLTEGLSVTIDTGKPESAPFQICTEQGCLVREPIDDALVSRFKRGNNAVISVIAANQGEVKATLSLSGFTKAYNGLK